MRKRTHLVLAANMVDRSVSVHEGVPKWKLALAIGAPVAVGLAGIWWYRSRRAKKVEKEPQPGTSGAVNAENVGQQGDAGLVSVCQNQNDAVNVVWDFFDKWLTDKQGWRRFV